VASAQEDFLAAVADQVDRVDQAAVDSDPGDQRAAARAALAEARAVLEVPAVLLSARHSSRRGRAAGDVVVAVVAAPAVAGVVAIRAMPPSRRNT
jgi:hypothetical protein